MCDPVTATLMAAGTGLKMAGSLFAGDSKAKTALANAEFSQLQAQGFEQQSEVATSNLDLLRTQADIAKLNIPIAEAHGRLLESRIRTNADKVESAQQLHFAYGNIDRGYGSPLVLAGNTAAEIETDVNLNRASTEIAVAGAATRVANIEQQAFGQAAAAVNARQNAILSLKKAGGYAGNAKSDLIAGVIGAGTALLSGLSSMAGGGKSSAPLWDSSNSFLANQPKDI